MLTFASIAFSGWWLFTRLGTTLTAADYNVFWRTVNGPLSQAYRPSIAPFPYPPPAVLWFEVLRLVPRRVGFILWDAGSAAAYFFSIRRVAGWRVAALSLVSLASISGLNLGQTSMLLASLLIFAAGFGTVALGVAVGIVAVIKPQLVFMASLIFLTRRDWFALGAAAGTGAVLCIASIVAFGVNLWVDWFHFLGVWRTIVHSQSVQVLTPMGYAEAHGFAGWPFLILGAACCIFLIIRVAGELEGLDLIALIVGASIMSSPYSVSHDAAGIVPAFASYVLASPSMLAFFPILGIAGLYQGPTLALIGVWICRPWTLLGRWPQRLVKPNRRV